MVPINGSGTVLCSQEDSYPLYQWHSRGRHLSCTIHTLVRPSSFFKNWSAYTSWSFRFGTCFSSSRMWVVRGCRCAPTFIPLRCCLMFSNITRIALRLLFADNYSALRISPGELTSSFRACTLTGRSTVFNRVVRDPSSRRMRWSIASSLICRIESRVIRKVSSSEGNVTLSDSQSPSWFGVVAVTPCRLDGCILLSSTS